MHLAFGALEMENDFFQQGAKHPTQTRIVDARLPGGFDLLGNHFGGGTRWPRR
jgi:hypothetical protein